MALKESRILLEDQNDDTAVPDVLSCVQEILSTIFVAMYNHHDAEERCYSDCLAELPEHDITEGKKVIIHSISINHCILGITGFIPL